MMVRNSHNPHTRRSAVGGRFSRRTRLLPALLVAAVLCSLIAGLGLLMVQPSTAQVAVAKPVKGPAANKARNILVNADDEFASYLNEALDFLENKQYDEAIRILHELMRMPNGGYVPTDTPNLYRGLRLKAAEILEKLDETGRKRYEMMYETQARELYNEAVATGNVQKLRTLTQIYRQTKYGPMAIQRLGAQYFDQGRFAQAEGNWRQLLTDTKDPAERAALLVRLVVACHFSGNSADSDKFLGELKSKHAGARGEMGGQMQDLAAYAEGLRRIDASTILTSSSRTVFSQGWPGLGGTPSGTGLMDDSHVLMDPRWTLANNNADKIDTTQLRTNLIAMGEFLNGGMFRNNYNPGMSQSNMRVELDGGHVQVRASMNGQALPQFALPPAIEPAIIGDAAIIRTSNAVIGLDLVTGHVIWQTGGPDSTDMKMERDLPNMEGYYYASNVGILYPDLGRYRVTIGGNRVFVLTNFRPYLNQYALQNINRTGFDRNALADTSQLVAIQITPNTPTSENQGKRIWKIGGGLGDDDTVRACKFLSAPTYKDGRLYVVVEYIDAYHLLCLDADRGSLLWKTLIAQVPTQTGYNPWSGMQSEQMDRAAPPAVADGRVYVCTQAGVLAAVEADSGLPLWAYQYAVRQPSGSMQVAKAAGLNPIIVAGNRVLALPSDSNALIGLSADTGQPLWPAVNRREQSDLSYIDDKRVLLSGDSLSIVDITNGTEIWPADKAEVGSLGIFGRPAVSQSAVLASGKDRLIRLSLSDYKITESELKSPFGVLGNLVCIKGKLIAANAAGICGYFNYEEAYKQMSERITQALGSDQQDLMFQRAKLSFSDARFDVCLADLAACLKTAEAAKDASAKAMLLPWFYRAYVGAANHAGKNEDMLANFRKAADYASTDQERAHLLLRLAKYYQKAGDLKAALATAQELGEKYPEQSLVDVKIGPEADEAIRTNERMPEKQAGTLAQELVAALVATAPGRTAYESFDAAAKAELDKARAARDPAALEQVAARWPNSIHAEPAMFAAAEEYCLQLPKLQGDKAQEAMSKIVSNLSRIMHGSGELNTRASLALALVWSRSGVKSFADLAMSSLDSEQLKAIENQDFSFADYKGTVKDLVQKIEKGATAASGPSVIRMITRSPKAYETLFDIKDQNTCILTNQDYEPVRLMDRVLALKDQHLVLIDTQAKDAESASRWSAMSTVSASTLTGAQAGPASRLVAGLSADHKIVSVADRQSVSGVDISQERIVWQKSMAADLGINSPQFMSMGSGLLIVNDGGAGKVACVNLANGEVAWQSQLTGPFRAFASPVAIRDGLALAISSDNRGLIVWNTKNGKIVLNVTAKQSLTACLSAGGLVVALVDGQLNIRDPKDLSKELWPTARAYQAGEIFAVTEDLVLVGSGMKPDRIDVLSISRGGEVLSTLNTGGPNGGGPRPVDALVANGKVYLTCFREASQTARRGGLAIGRMPSVQVFSLKDGSRLWQAELDPDREKFFQLMPLRVCGDAVIVSPANVNLAGQQANQARVYVLNDSAKGKMAAVLSPELESEQGRRMWSPPVVTNERMLMETSDGLRVIGGR